MVQDDAECDIDFNRRRITTIQCLLGLVCYTETTPPLIVPATCPDIYSFMFTTRK